MSTETRTTTRWATCPDFTVDDLRIRERTPNWSESRPVPGHQLCFVRRGVYDLRLPRWVGQVDPLAVYLSHPGDEFRIAHRPEVEDACTVVTLDDALAEEATPRRWPEAPLATSAEVDLRQRTLLARARRGADEFELTERLLRLVEGLFDREQDRHHPVPTPRPSHRRLVDAARERVITDPAVHGFGDLASSLGVSRPHLSRVFRALTGETLTSFRARVRVRAALEDIDAGRTGLADLAAELGFADHAHLTRTVRGHLGRTPLALRALFHS